MKMRLSDVVRLMDIEPSSAYSFVAKKLGVERSQVNGAGEVSLQMLKALADRYPAHNKQLIITCTPQDTISVCLLGHWDGRLMRAAGKVFNKCYKLFKQATMAGKEETTFRTRPSADMIRQERKERAQVVLEREIAEGIRNEDGTVKPERMGELNLAPSQEEIASTAEELNFPISKENPISEKNHGGENMDTVPRARVRKQKGDAVLVSIPEPEPVTPVTPGQKPAPQHDAVAHRTNAPNGGVGTGVQVIKD